MPSKAVGQKQKSENSDLLVCLKTKLCKILTFTKLISKKCKFTTGKINDFNKGSTKTFSDPGHKLVLYNKIELLFCSGTPKNFVCK